MNDEKAEQQALPEVPLAPEDIRVIDAILIAHINYLRNVSPAPQTAQRIAELENIRGRLLLLRPGNKRNVVMISTDDLRAINEAMITFIKLTRRIVPQSAERDETLRLVDELRKHLVTSACS